MFRNQNRLVLKVVLYIDMMGKHMEEVGRLRVNLLVYGLVIGVVLLSAVLLPVAETEAIGAASISGEPIYFVKLICEETEEGVWKCRIVESNETVTFYIEEYAIPPMIGP